MRSRKPGLVVLFLTVFALLDCVGETEDATDVTDTSAKLNATGTCESGGCDYYFRVWPLEVGEAWGFSTPERALRNMPPDTTSPLPPELVSGLLPATSYGFRACGKEAHETEFLCANQMSFTTEPPPEIPEFTAETTAPNVVTLRWATAGGDTTQPIHLYGTWHDPDTGTFHRNIGFRAEHQNQGGLTFRVRFGHHRWVLALPTAAGGEVTRRVEIEVPGPPSPNVTTRLVNLYAPLLADTTLTWDNPDPGHFVRVARHGHTDRFDTALGASSYTFDQSYLEALGQGTHRFDLYSCQNMAGLTPSMSGNFCGDRATVVLEIDAAQFTGPRRLHVTTGGSVTVSWTPVGQFAVLDAPSLGIDGELTTETSRTFEDLPAGLHDIGVTSCTAYPPTCADLTGVSAPVAGTLEYVASRADLYFGHALAGSSVLARIRAADQSLVDVVAPASGFLQYTHVSVGDPVAVGDALHSILTGAFDEVQLVVGDEAFERRNWKDDYSPWISGRHVVPHYNHVRIGNTMPVLAAGDGTVWAAGEFAEGSVLSITGDWSIGHTLTPFAAPLLHKDDGERLLPVKPFKASNGGRGEVTKQETVVEAGPYVWIINGGLRTEGETPDWNRLLRFDRSAVDLHTTPEDDRFCVFHVPFDGANVMGLAWDEAAHLVWYVESRKPKNETPVLGWFDPDELACENFLDYSDPAAVAAASTQYCEAPSDTGCIHTVTLADFQDPSQKLHWAAHVAIDAEAAWVAGFFSTNVARYDRATGLVDVFPAPHSSGLARLVGPGPWKLVSEPDYVYFTEFFDGDVVRLDKQQLAADPASCKSLVDGENPCMTELHVGSQLKELHAQGDRLYFAGYDGFGYLHKSAFSPGVIYDGLESLRDPERAKRGDLLTGDLSVGPGGAIVLNDYMAHQVYRLYPKAP